MARRRTFFSTTAKRAATAAAAATVAAGMALTTAQPASAGTALIVGGFAQPVLSDLLLAQTLDFRYTGIDPATGTEWVRRSVIWPASVFGPVDLAQSVRIGRDNLLAQIASTSGPITVVGVSAGALVANEVMRYYDENPQLAPSAGRVTFVVVADGTRGDAFQEGGAFNTLGGYTYRRPAETKYNVTSVTNEYDGLADFPDRPFNLLAVANAIAGAVVLHNATFYTNLDELPSNTRVTVIRNADGGTTVEYLVPAAQLPLVTLVPSLAALEPVLKLLIDTGYSRNDANFLALLGLGPQPQAVATTLAATVAEQGVAEQGAVAEVSSTAPSTLSAARVASAVGGDDAAVPVVAIDETPAIADTPATDTPATDGTAVDTPAVDTPVVDTPAVDGSAVVEDTVASDEAASDEVAPADAAGTETTDTEKDGSGTSDTEKAGAEKAGAETSGTNGTDAKDPESQSTDATSTETKSTGVKSTGAETADAKDAAGAGTASDGAATPAS